MPEEKKTLVSNLRKLLGAATIRNWNDISVIVKSVKNNEHAVEVSGRDAFHDSLKKGIAFITYDFGIDGVSIEIGKYADCLARLLADDSMTDLPLHFIGGDFLDKADAVLHPDWHRFEIEGMNGWSKWDGGKWFSRLYYEEMPENSAVSDDMAVEIWEQACRFSEKLGGYLADNDISLLIPVNISCNPGNMAIALAVVMVTEAMGIPVINSNHDFYWEGGKPARNRDPVEEPGIRDHFFKNMDNTSFFELFKALYPWNGNHWVQVNINTRQSETLVNTFGFTRGQCTELSTSISDEFFKAYSDDDVAYARLRMAYILSDGKPVIKPVDIQEHISNLKLWMGDQKPIVCACREGLELDPVRGRTVYCLQPTRVIARKRIEKDVHLIGALMTHPPFRQEFENDPGIQIVLHVTGAVPIEHEEDLKTVLNAYADLCSDLPDALAERIFIAFSVGTEKHPCFKEKGLARLHIEDIYRLASIILFPSETEGRGLPIIESSACGIPIVCSRYYPEDVFREVVGEDLPEEEQIHYILFPEEDFPLDMLDRVTALLLRRETETELIEHNKNAVRKRYSAERLASVFGSVLDTLRQSYC